MRFKPYSIRTFCFTHRISNTTFHREVRAGRLHPKKKGYFVSIPIKEAKRWADERRPFLVNVNCCRYMKGARRRKGFAFGVRFQSIFGKRK